MSNSKQKARLVIALEYYKKIAMFEDYEITSPISQGMDGDTPFHMAAYDGNLSFIKDMLPFVPDINIEGDIGNTPLHYAVMKAHLEAVQFLLNNGADIFKENDYGYTPLDYMESEAIFEQMVAQYLKK